MNFELTSIFIGRIFHKFTSLYKFSLFPSFILSVSIPDILLTSLKKPDPLEDFFASRLFSNIY